MKVLPSSVVKPEFLTHFDKLFLAFHMGQKLIFLEPVLIRKNRKFELFCSCITAEFAGWDNQAIPTIRSLYLKMVGIRKFKKPKQMIVEGTRVK